MQEQRFKIIVSGQVVAENVASDFMLLFVDAFFDKFTGEDELLICRQNPVENTIDNKYLWNVAEKGEANDDW